MEKKALGRGLEALLPVVTTENSKKNHDVIQVQVSHVLPNQFQPRHDFHEEELAMLAESIKQSGILQPIVVRQKGDGLYELIAGERRLRAAKMAGLHTIPAILHNCGDNQAMILSLVENIQRQDLNPMDAARAYRRLINEFKMTQEYIANQLGKDRASVANVTRLVNLPLEIQSFVETGQLSIGHAKVILSLERPDAQINLAKKIIANQLTVRHTEREVARVGSVKKKNVVRMHPSPLRDIEERIQRKIGTKVTILQGKNIKNGGKLTIHYFSPEELERIIDILMN